MSNNSTDPVNDAEIKTANQDAVHDTIGKNENTDFEEKKIHAGSVSKSVGLPFIKNHKKLFAVVSILLILIVTISAWYFFLRPAAGDRFSSTVNPLNVTESLGAVKATKILGDSNKTLELVDSRNVSTEITFSDKSFSSSTKVVAQEISSLSNLPNGWQLVSGVNITPSGTRLDHPATLQIELPSGLTTSKLIGFAYDENGKNFHIVPLSIKDSVATLKIDSFSGHGVVNVGDSKQVPPDPDGIEAQAKQDIAAIIWLNSLQQATGVSDGLNPKQLNGINDIITDWFKEGVEPRLKVAEGKSSKEVDEAAHAYIAWLGIVQAFGLEDEQRSNITRGEDQAALNLKKAVEIASTKCQNSHDLEQVAFILRWYALGELMGLDGKNGYSSEKTKSLATKCAQFELTFKSSIHGQAKSDSNAYDDAKAEGKITISTDENLELKGNGKIKEVSYSVDGKACTPSSSLEYDVTIENGVLTAQNESQSASLILTLKEVELDNFKYTCAITEDGILTSGGIDSWNSSFNLLHEADVVAMDGDKTSYLIDGWQIVNNGDLFARRNYAQIKDDTYGTKYNEVTTLELKHISR